MSINKKIPSHLIKKILRQINLDHNYHYDILNNAHAEKVIEMFTKSFCDSEPMTRYVNMDYSSFSVFAEKVVKKAIEDSLSIVALDREKIIACALIEDMAHPLEIKASELSPKFFPIFALLEELTMPFLKDRTFPKNKLTHLFITAVDEKYQGQGLSKQVNFRAMALAASKGYSLMFSELTNHLNEKGILHHLQTPKHLIRFILYDQYTKEGRQPFQGLKNGASAYVWSLDFKNLEL